MLAASRIKFDMVLDNHHGLFISLGLCFGFAGALNSSIDRVSLKDNFPLGVNHYGSCILVNGLDHPFGIAVLILSGGKIWFVYCTTSSQQQSEGFIVIFSEVLVTPKSFDFLSHEGNLRLK
jgi:hypothetical protein